MYLPLRIDTFEEKNFSITFFHNILVIFVGIFNFLVPLKVYVRFNKYILIKVTYLFLPHFNLESMEIFIRHSSVLYAFSKIYMEVKIVFIYNIRKQDVH